MPDISPDNRWVAYVVDRDSSSNIWLVSAKGGTPVRLTAGRFTDFGPIWFPTGDRIVFVSNRPSRAGGNSTLMVVAVDPETGRSLGPPSPIGEEPGGFGAPSPDGGSVAYASRTVDGVSRVMIVSASGGASRELASYRQGWAPTGPELLWSNDGKWIFHVLQQPGTTNHVFMRVAVADGVPQQLAVFNARVVHPDATGQFVLRRLPNDTTARDRDSRPPDHEIATIDGRPVARFVVPPGMWLYRFSADGRSLMAQRRDSSGTSLWRLNIGNALQRAQGARPQPR